MRRSVVALLAVALTSAAGCSRRPDEQRARQREAEAIRDALGSTQVALYRTAKLAVRCLPPREAVQRLTSGKSELTRDELAALLANDPQFAPLKDRVGMFVAGVHLREAAYTGAIVAAAVLAAQGGGRLAGSAPEARAWALPRTANPFGSPAAFYRECRSLLSDDEDRYPTLCVSMLPEAAQADAREGRGAFAAPPLARLRVPAFEHMVLGCAWFAVQPSLCLYELDRARMEDLTAVEEAVARAARATTLEKNEWHYHALDELSALERRLPELGRSAVELHASVRPEQAEAALSGLLHLMRYQIYLRLERAADARTELRLAQEALGRNERLAAAAHLIAAKVLLDEGQYKRAAAEVRLAAEALPGDAETRRQLLELAARIERELPDSSSSADLIAFAARIAYRQARALAVPADVGRWADGFRDRAGEQLAAWERAFPGREELHGKAAEWWRKLRPGPSPAPAP